MASGQSVKGWQVRHTLVCLAFLGFVLFYSLRFNLAIAIVAMVSKHSDNKHERNASTSSSNSLDVKDDICAALVKVRSNETDTAYGIQSNLEYPEVVSFEWDEMEQGVILGSFFWGYVLTQIPGGLLAQRFGGKIVIGMGMLWAGILSLILPFAAGFGGKTLVIIIRILQGISEGIVFPAFTHLLAKWTAPHERATMASLCFSGMPFGTAITMVASGHLISSFGWPSVFYVPGVLTCIWFVLWMALIHSSPSEHPRISKEERDIIMTGIGLESHKEKAVSQIPWKDIFQSGPFWGIFTAHICSVYGLNTLNHEGPKFLSSVLHFEIKDNAYIAATPHVTQFLFCIVVCKLSDSLISRNKLSVEAARKICNAIAQWGTALAFVGMIVSGCNRTFAVICFMLSGLFNGAVFGGFLISPVDISPNYAGPIEGLINGVSNVAGFGAPYVAGMILQNEPSLAGWQFVFAVPAVLNFIGNLAYLILFSAQVQPWNDKQMPRKIPL